MCELSNSDAADATATRTAGVVVMSAGILIGIIVTVAAIVALAALVVYLITDPGDRVN